MRLSGCQDNPGPIQLPDHIVSGKINPGKERTELAGVSEYARSLCFTANAACQAQMGQDISCKQDGPFRARAAVVCDDDSGCSNSSQMMHRLETLELVIFSEPMGTTAGSVQTGSHREHVRWGTVKSSSHPVDFASYGPYTLRC